MKLWAVLRKIEAGFCVAGLVPDAIRKPLDETGKAMDLLKTATVARHIIAKRETAY